MKIINSPIKFEDVVLDVTAAESEPIDEEKHNNQ